MEGHSMPESNSDFAEKRLGSDMKGDERLLHTKSTI